MASKERAARSCESDDLCILAPGGRDKRERHFIRGVVLLPLDRKSWGIGIWAEVSRRSFEYYRKHYDADGRKLPRFPGRLANDVGSLGTLGRRVEVQLAHPKRRPTFWFPSTAVHRVASLQAGGISHEQLHEVLRRDAPALLEG